MKSNTFLAMLTVGIFGIFSLAANAQDYNENATLQSDKAAFEMDVDLLFAANPKFSKDQIRKSLKQQEAVSLIAAEIDSDTLVEVTKSSKFSDDRVVVVTQPISDELRKRIEATGASLKVADESVYSFRQQGERAEAVSKALTEMGYKASIVTPVDVVGNIVISLPEEDQARVMSRGSETAFKAQIAFVANSMPVGPPNLSGKPLGIASDEQSIRNQGSLLSRALRTDDIAFKFVPLSHIESDDLTVRGGQYQVTTGTCTSGWTIRWQNSWDGWLTSGHCMTSGAAQLYDPAGLWDQSWYQWGYVYLDAGIVLTNSAISNQFYASDTALRTQGAVGVASQHDSVCVYGRKSNTRFCSRTVAETNQCLTTSYGTTCYLTKLNINNGSRFICQGDSGGGVSWGTTMYGIIKGGGPSGANSDCNGDWSTNYTREWVSQITTIRDWLSVAFK